MTTKQIQCLLTFHGYDTGGIDGVRGPKTARALQDFQKTQGVTGEEETCQALARSVREAPRGSFWEEIPNFTRNEFACQCGCGFPAEPKEEMVRIAQAARTHFGRPATIVSGVRCRSHNARVGGVANSQHMAGEACDLTVDGVSGDDLLAFLQSQPGVRYAYKINAANVHFDIPKGGA